jgi:hypothetical protein
MTQRVQIRQLPNVPSVCTVSGAGNCVYYDDTICDNPQTAKRNSYSHCYKRDNKYVLAHLVRFTGERK